MRFSVPGRRGEVLGADDAQQVELVAGVGARTWEQHDEALVAVAPDEDVAQQVQQADFGVDDPACGRRDGRRPRAGPTGR
jgi:hypothetical protein